MVRKPPWIDKVVYNYKLVLRGTEDCCALTVAEYISSEHTVHAILLFLSRFMYILNKKAPPNFKIDLIRTDFSFPLMHAISLIVNEVSLSRYLKHITVQHICSSHVVKSIAKSDRDFYPPRIIENFEENIDEKKKKMSEEKKKPVVNSDTDEEMIVIKRKSNSNEKDKADEVGKKMTKEEKKKAQYGLKKFLLNATQLLIHSETIESTEQILQHMVAIFDCPYEVEGFAESFEFLTQVDIIPDESKQLVNDIIDEENKSSETVVDEIDKKHGDFSEKRDETKDNDCSILNPDVDMPGVRKQSPFYIHFENFRQKIERNLIETLVPNRYFSKKYMQHLFEFMLPYYPLWAAPILKRLGYRRGSNASIENDWKHTKRNRLNSKLKLLPQIYIRKTEPYILTDLANQGSSFKTTKCSKKKR